ncbi:DUF4231 domain-containing protein [Nocardia sp. NPDC052254]|uniref:DUF4231 domain-containing protein n=1 Tax=Nocardia sp. NPDC052254 TaxID=3155681 RepID=UPI0034161839
MTDAREQPRDREDPVLRRLHDQLDWYRHKSRSAQTAYKRVKFGQIAVGAIIPVIAAAGVAGWITATVAAAVVVAEGAQQLFQWHTHWLLYRSAAEELKHEDFLYSIQSGPYAGDDRRMILAERVEAVTNKEHTAWVARGRSQAAAPSMTQLAGTPVAKPSDLP